MQEKFIGTVIRGLGKGKDFGFPTANIKLINNELHIENGVYVVNIEICNQEFNGMLYVGTRPTFDLQEITIEIHIFDFREDIYNQQIFFQILHKIRNEIDFESTEKLIEQLYHDKEMVYDYLSSIFFNSSKL
jgi:riboflavin kinase/FMN adenylyltransferase